MISALVDGFKALRSQTYLSAARVAADFILSTMYKDGRLLRTYGQGKAKLLGYLDDYAYFIQALLDLSSVDGSRRWLDTALSLNATVMDLFWSEEEEDFFFTSTEHESLITRTKSYYDGSIPSPTSVSVQNLLRLSRLTNNEDWQKKAETVLDRLSPYFSKAPDQFSNSLCALDFLQSPPVELLVLLESSLEKGEPENSDMQMILAANSHYLPNAIVLTRNLSENNSTWNNRDSHLLEGRKALAGKATAYLCRNFSCERPTDDPGELIASLRNL